MIRTGLSKRDAEPDQNLDDGWRAELRTIHNDGLVARGPREEGLGLVVRAFGGPG